MSMNQQGLLLFTGLISRIFKRVGLLLALFTGRVSRVFPGIGGFLGILAHRFGGFLLGVGPVLEQVFAGILFSRITGHDGEPEQGAPKQHGNGFDLHNFGFDPVDPALSPQSQ